MLVDVTAGHSMFFFMDGFSGCNHIRMEQLDAEETAFRTHFHYTIMWQSQECWCHLPICDDFTFHDMLDDCLEDYIDDIIVKSKEDCNHIDDIRKVSTTCIKYNMRMKPLKCALVFPLGSS